MGDQNRSVWTWAILASAVFLVWWTLAPQYLHQTVSTVKEDTSSYIVETIESPSSTESLKDLGLKPKKAVEIIDADTGEKRIIHGRFLHITDLHPDLHYKPGSDIDSMCHGGKGDAGRYGDAILGCDSPMSLVEQTLDWIAEHLKDKIDFIVWTGDNMRHDNDREYPRTEQEIFDTNEKVSRMMLEKFGTMPVPSLGNNDVYPHNLFAPGPTLQTRELFKIWRPFVPQAQLHIFNRGVYFFQEVIPNKLAILSLNTLYLFRSNPLVESCDKRKDPGYKVFLWLGYVLEEMRSRNMKVWLTGHVPPTAKNYDISCLRKYILWSHEYRDVIVGGLYGHMNIDHFLPLDSKQALRSMNMKYQNVRSSDTYESEDSDSDSDSDSDAIESGIASLEDLYKFYNTSVVHDTIDGMTHEFDFDFDFTPPRNVEVKGGIPKKKVAYMDSVRESMYAEIKGKKKSGVYGERYSIAHVTASVVPTFNPGFRVWEYNISDLHNTESIRAPSWNQFFANIDSVFEEDDDQEDLYVVFKDKAEAFKRDKTFPRKMPKGTPLGPAYVPQLFTPERYVQYYLDLKAVNENKKKFSYEIEYATDDKIYHMDDLTVANWLKLGRELGRPVKEEKIGLQNVESKHDAGSMGGKDGKRHRDQLWKTFLAHSFCSSHYEILGYG